MGPTPEPKPDFEHPDEEINPVGTLGPDGPPVEEFRPEPQTGRECGHPETSAWEPELEPKPEPDVELEPTPNYEPEPEPESESEPEPESEDKGMGTFVSFSLSN